MEQLDICRQTLYIKRIINVIRARNPHHHETLHIHSRHSDAFVYILSGECTYEVSGGAKFTVHPGDILYLAKNAHYTMFIHDSNYRFIYCDFEFDSPRERRSQVFSPKNDAHTEHLFTRLMNAFVPGSSAAFANSMASLYAIYAAAVSASGSYLNGSAKSKMAEAKHYIDTHFAEKDLRISQLAEQADMSQVYFRKLFREAWGCTPSQYAVSVRLQRAKALMEYPFLTLEECAEQSGFSSLQYFCKVFKKEVGTTPSKYRKKALSGRK